MHPKQHLFLVLLSLFFLSSYAQKNVPLNPKCGSNVDMNAILSDPEKARAYFATEKLINDKISKMKLVAAKGVTVNTVITIPVVFHIVATDPNSITDGMIQLQLAVLNRDFEGTNPDFANAPAFFGIRGLSKIKFELAKRSPRGCDTTGIVRVTSALSVHSNIKDANGVVISPSTISLLKYTVSGGSDAWESYDCKYLNIWIGDLTNDLLGQATFPNSNIPSAEQGAVIHKSTFSFTPGQFTFGRTLVHEIGHYFNLKHIWGDDEAQPNKCAWSDEIDDTPNQAVPTFGAPVGLKYDICSPAPATDGINYQNYMDYCDDVVLTMFTKKQVERMVASFSVFPNRSFLIDKNNKALKPREDNQLYNLCNTASFTTNNFTSIGIGRGGVVWAGSANSGLYNYSGGKWRQMPSFINNLYQDIKPDKNGGIWVAQSGFSGAQANTGGILYFADSVFPAVNNFYSFSNGLPSRNVRSLFIDTSRTFTSGVDTPLIFTGNFAHITAGVSAAGGVGRGFLPVVPNYFTRIRKGLQQSRVTDGTASIYVIGGDSKVIWAHTQNNYGRSQILRYNNTVLTDTLRSLDVTNIFADGFLPDQFNAKGIYFDAKGNRWITVNGTGIVVTDSTEAVWDKVNFAQLFPTAPSFNNGAIAGDTAGNVYFGTTAGLIVYTAGKPFDDLKSYKLYTTNHGLPSNNVKSIAVDSMRQKLLLATDNGIVFWNPTCANGPIVDNQNFSTTATGDWNNPAIWCNGVVPPVNAKIIVRHPVTITTNTHCQSLQLVLPGSFMVATGIKLLVGN